MPALITLFDQQRESLEKQLAAAPEPEAVARETRRFLDNLRFLYMEQPDCQEIQRRLLPFVLDTLKSSVNYLAASSRTELWRKQIASVPVSGHRRWYQRPWMVRAGQLLLTLLLFSSLMEDPSAEGFVNVLLLAGLISLEFFTLPQAERLRLRLPGRLGRRDPAEQWQVSVKVEIADFLRGLADSLLTADKLLSEVTALQAPPSSGDGLESYGPVLALFQDLLEARDTGDRDYALKKTKSVPAILEQYGITVQGYDGDNPQWFDFLPSLDPGQQDAQTISPALIKDGRLLNRGRVTDPDL